MRRGLLAAALLATLAIGVTQALATGVRPTIAEDNNFDTSDGAIDEGFTGVLVNDGPSNTHNVTGDANGPDGKPLFRTGNVPAGQMREIDGTQYLSAGSYAFFCSLHPGMTGTLPVSDGLGTDPKPRPDISLKVKSKKLGKVVDSGKLKVKVKAKEPTPAEGIRLKGKKGKKAITKGKSLNLAAGAAKTVKLKLSDRGLDKLAGADSAKVKVEGTVDFGFGDKASKKLR